MKRILTLLLLTPFSLFSQVQDDFSDSDFTTNPAWSGDAGKFIISNYNGSGWSQPPRLQLNGSGADTSCLYVYNPVNNSGEYQWDLWVRLAFNTSKTNNFRYYLCADQPNFKGSLNGYFLMFGDDQNDAADSITLCRQNGSTYQKIIRGSITTTSAPGSYRIRVIRENTGTWTLLSRPSGSTVFVTEGFCTDPSFTSYLFTGLYCKYTSTNKTNFYFDDFYSGPRIIDSIPPQILSAETSGSGEITLRFSENLTPASVQNVSNYLLNQTFHPNSAATQPGNPAEVHLSFTYSFPQDSVLFLQIANLCDESGNAMAPDTLCLWYHVPSAFDVVINEIMADPDPPTGLPEFEYIELYNRTSVPVSLTNWTLKAGSSSKTFPGCQIGAGSYFLIYPENAATSFNIYGPGTGFSSFNLTNQGMKLLLSDASGNPIHQIEYSDGWYRDDNKKYGGWSLEQTDPDNPCAEASNWQASVHVSGGTPGSQNSVFSHNPDTLPPAMLQADVIDKFSILLTFTEKLANIAEFQPGDFSVSPANNINSIVLPTDDSKRIRLTTQDSVCKNQVYTLSLNHPATDCCGNVNPADSIRFARFAPSVYDIVINEIMADPDPVAGLPPSEYIELYNRTDFPISLSGWRLMCGSQTCELSNCVIGGKDYLILAGSGGINALGKYGRVAELQGLSLSNTGSLLALADTNGRVVSWIYYSGSWYSDDTRSQGGWALEQVDPFNACNGKSNWKYSSDPLGGTPGGINSMYANNPDIVSPLATRAAALPADPYSVRVYFSEPIDSISVKTPDHFIIDNGIGSPYSVKTLPPLYNSVLLSLTSPLQQGVIYNIVFADSILDCNGNKLTASSVVKLALPLPADPGDVVINEIMPEAKEGGTDWVELYNRSGKVVDIHEFDLSGSADLMSDLKPVSETPFILFPGEYLVLSSDAEKVLKYYSTNSPWQFSDMPSFPSLSGDADRVTLLNKTGSVIDAADYDGGMHISLLSETSGVSLERIDYNRPASDRTNWHSASATSGFGTPAMQNSQYSAIESAGEFMSIAPDVFSPDNDGTDDVLNITLTTATTGMIATVAIYDVRGRLVRTLASNHLMGSTWTLTWDGYSDKRIRLETGIYIVCAELYSSEGKTMRSRKTAVIAGRL